MKINSIRDTLVRLEKCCDGWQGHECNERKLLANPQQL